MNIKHIFASAALGVGGYALGKLGIDPVGFTSAYAPAIMAAAGAALPPAWWLLANLPPKPVDFPFPGIALFDDVAIAEQKPKTMPPWKKAICLTPIVAAAIAASNPQISQNYIATSGAEPIVIAVDDGWVSAKNWDARKEQLEALIREAESKGRKIVLLSNGAPEEHYEVMEAGEARAKILSWKPKSWPVDRQSQVPVLQKLQSDLSGPTSVFWLSNGFDDGSSDFISTIQQLGSVSVFQSETENDPHLLSLLKSTGNEITVTVTRPDDGEEKTLSLTASNELGQPLAQQEAVFADGEVTKDVVFKLDPAIRRDITRISIDGELSAGSVLLLDEKWQERSIGLVNTSSSSSTLNEINFIRQATKPFTDYNEGSLSDLIKKNLSVIVLTDDTSLSEQERSDLEKWVEAGGTLLRFAGPQLAAKPDDSLVPVPLRMGVKHTGGTLSGGDKERLAPFGAASPFKGISIPDDLDIKKLVLAESDSELDKYTWARLENGMPIVTAKPRGEGSIILVHTAASPSWSNMPIEGAEMFLPMLQAIVTHSNSMALGGELDRAYSPYLTLNANGRLEPPAHTAKPLTSEVLTTGKMNIESPPGYYGSENRVAYNISDVSPEPFDRLDDLPSTISTQGYAVAAKDTDYGAWLWSLAALGLVGGIAVSGGLSFSGGTRRPDKKVPKPENA